MSPLGAAQIPGDGVTSRGLERVLEHRQPADFKRAALIIQNHVRPFLSSKPTESSATHGSLMAVFIIFISQRREVRPLARAGRSYPLR